MTHPLRILPGLLAAVVGMGCAARLAEADRYAPVVGVRHPNITLPRIGSGQPVSLHDFRGRKVLLIHFASW